MECSNFRDLISLYIDGMFDKQQEEEFRAHMDICDECRYEMYEMMELVKLCNSIPEEDLPDDFKQELRIKLLAEKEKHKKSKWINILGNRSMKYASGIAAAVMLIFAMRGLFIHQMPLGNTNRSEISVQFAKGSATERANSPQQESDPQTDFHDESGSAVSGSSSQDSQESLKTQTDAGTAEPEVAKVHGRKFSDNVSLKLSGAGTAEEATDNKTGGNQERYINKEGTRGSVAQEQTIMLEFSESMPDGAFASGVPEDEESAVTVRQDQGNSGMDDHSYKFCNVSEITIKASNPSTEAERIKLYLVARGAEILDPAVVENEIPLNEITGNTNIRQNKARGGVIIFVRIPVSLYPRVIAAMRSSFSPSVLTVSRVYSVDVSQMAKELENSLLNIEVQMLNALKANENVSSEILNPMKELKDKASRRLKWIKEGANNVFVVISITRS